MPTSTSVSLRKQRNVMRQVIAGPKLYRHNYLFIFFYTCAQEKNVNCNKLIIETTKIECVK